MTDVCLFDHGHEIQYRFTHPVIHSVSLRSGTIRLQTQDLVLDSLSSSYHAIVDEMGAALSKIFGPNALTQYTENSCLFVISVPGRNGDISTVMNAVASIRVPACQGGKEAGAPIFTPHDIAAATAQTAVIPAFANPFSAI